MHRAEHPDLIVYAAVGLHALGQLLGVMQDLRAKKCEKVFFVVVVTSVGLATTCSGDRYLCSGMHLEWLQRHNAGVLPSLLHVPRDSEHVVGELLAKDEILDGGFGIELSWSGGSDLEL